MQKPTLRLGRLALLPLLFVVPIGAFPPAPHYTLYGTVRDQVGQTIRTEGAALVLLKGETEVSKTPVQAGLRLDQNYELSMRIDANRPGLTAYSEKAVEAGGVFSLAVELNGVRYYPIEVAGTLKAGKGGERVRLDLNLGEDTDRDGLPDVWEQWQLYQAGHSPDALGNWPLNLIDRNGDFDSDGQSNWMEYVAGTFAGDAAETFKLEIKDKNHEAVRFEFFAITGKTYTIERSPDMKTWTAVPFSVGGNSVAGAKTWTSANVSVVTAFTGPETDGKNFYRLTVR